MLTVQSSFKTHLLVNQQAVAITIARLTVTQASAFRRGVDRMRARITQRDITIRKPGDEMAMRPVPRPRTDAETAAAVVLEGFDEQVLTGLPEMVRVLVDACRALVPPEPTDEVFAIPDQEIRERRLAEMSPEARTEYERRAAAEDEAIAMFVQEAIGAYVTVEPGQVQEVDEAGTLREVVSGAELAQAFAARPDVLDMLITQINAENTLPEAAKKAWRLLSGSAASSAAPESAVDGPRPATTATAAAPPDSVTSEAAMALSETG